MSRIFGWLLNGVYILILLAVSPVLVYRRIKQGKYRKGWREKLTGRLIRRHPQRRCLWFHAVSVGEVVQIQPLIEDTRKRYPDHEIVITVTTETGYDVAKSKYPDQTISYFPLDFTWAVRNALRCLNPEMIVLVELELWPNFIFQARRQAIRLALINGRMGEKSFNGYRRLTPLMRSLLSCFDLLAVQNETYAQRLRMLGAPDQLVVVTGNIKFDRVESNRDNSRTRELRDVFRLSAGDKVFIAGSTQDPEETYALDAWEHLRIQFPNLRLILVPRHKERFEEVAGFVISRGHALIRRSLTLRSDAQKLETHQDSTSDKSPVLLLDTLGELAACWGLADIAFVGGSLTNRGGQNMIEPAGYGAAVLFGPNTWNFKDVTEALKSEQAARVITGADDLRETICELLLHPADAVKLGTAARAFVDSQQGAVRRTLDLLAAILEKTDRLAPVKLLNE